MALSAYVIPQTDAKKETSSTEILLDSMNNKVHVAFENGVPAYYYSNIFTPVCNTGECLPVYINIYWDLSGKYLRFDQPVGEILTKLDHIPFSAEDYILLDQILRGTDPRYAYDHSDLISPVKHSQSQHSEQTVPNPAPSIQKKKMISKYEMIDGVTGATAIQHKAQFVPGALYTTYTIWGLANDHSNKILDYTITNFLKPTYYNYFLSHNEWSTYNLLLEKFYAEKTEPNARVNTQMNIIDTTSSVQVQYNILLNVSYDSYQLDTVSRTLERVFFGDFNDKIQRQILTSWTYYYTPDSTLLRLSKSVHLYPELFNAIIDLFSYKVYWPTGVVANLIGCMKELSQMQRALIYGVMDVRKSVLDKEDLTRLKVCKKKYNL